MNATADPDGRPWGQGWGEEADQAGMVARRKAWQDRRPQPGQYPHPARNASATGPSQGQEVT